METKHSKVVKFLNKQFEIDNLEVTRSQILVAAGAKNSGSYSTVDMTRRKLELMGFLKSDNRGNYKILKKIPEQLMSSDLDLLSYSSKALENVLSVLKEHDEVFTIEQFIKFYNDKFGKFHWHDSRIILQEMEAIGTTKSFSLTSPLVNGFHKTEEYKNFRALLRLGVISITAMQCKQAYVVRNLDAVKEFEYLKDEF